MMMIMKPKTVIVSPQPVTMTEQQVLSLVDGVFASLERINNRYIDSILIELNGVIDATVQQAFAQASLSNRRAKLAGAIRDQAAVRQS